MDKEKLSKAKELDYKIDAIKLEIDRIDDIKNDNLNILVTDNYRYFDIPPELKNTLILLVINHYEEKLKELEQEFEEM